MISAGIINQVIKEGEVDTNLVSDGYHTFGELYEHRIALYITLCRILALYPPPIINQNGVLVYRSKQHHDGTMYPGWFILGVQQPHDAGQISYHLPMERWDLCGFAVTMDKAIEWDGHTPSDVIKRLLNMVI